MILIADSGSTKTKWSLTGNGSTAQTCVTEGINPFFRTGKVLLDSLKREFTLPVENISAVYFYGAGCTPETSPLVSDALSAFFNTRSVEVHSDLLAAARSLCDGKEGIACILGTGSNSCYYDGEKIVSAVSSLGYILGDEGSGAVLGKKLVAGVFKNQLPDPVVRDFQQTFRLSLAEIMENVYRRPFPNRFLAQFVPFILDRTGYPEVRELVRSSFAEFIEKNILSYRKARSLPVHFTGSVAYHLKHILEEECSRFDLQMGNVTKEPMPGLLKYHLKKK
ncbi:MAG: ATPase [Dysgonamonadaceae bacterium]|jgi:N-acetylglucosamine kinase-like BadF-type ATPase|nr:ATPase [Dysgonamonadaceae bacterium]